jgi:hypothetical protein
MGLKLTITANFHTPDHKPINQIIKQTCISTMRASKPGLGGLQSALCETAEDSWWSKQCALSIKSENKAQPEAEVATALGSNV